MSKPLTRPIDICDQCDELLPLVAITPTIKTLKYIVRAWEGKRYRLHQDCVSLWDAAHPKGSS